MPPELAHVVRVFLCRFFINIQNKNQELLPLASVIACQQTKNYLFSVEKRISTKGDNTF